MVICAVEQNHFDWSPANRFGGCQTTKAASNDYDTRQFLIHSFLFSFQFIKPLVVQPWACFSGIPPGDEDEIGGCQDETHRPPDGSQQESISVRSDGVRSQRILRRKCRMKHYRKKRRGSCG